MIRTAVRLICLFAALLGTASTALAEKRVALIIGNSAYAHAERLTNPANDAAALAETLRTTGFDEVTLKRDLTYGEMRRTFGDFARTSAGADIALLYFAGHGIEIGGTNYLVPTDARLAHADDVEFEAVALTTALHALNRAGKLKLVILDACRNNPFVPGMEQTGASRSIGRGLARVSPPSGDTLVAYAAKEGTLATDGDGANSPYAAALIKHIATPGLDVRLLFGRVRDDVLAATGGKQEPFIYGSLGGSQIFVAPGATPEAPQSAAAPSGAGAGDQATQVSEAAEAWALIRDSERTSDLRAFVEAFPDTFYAKLAASRLETLERPTPPEEQGEPDVQPVHEDLTVGLLAPGAIDRPRSKPELAPMPPVETAAAHAIVLDGDTNTVLFEKNADELIDPASMSKLMTMVMVFEALKRGDLKLDQALLVSENAWRNGGAASGAASMFAEINSKVALENLIRGVVVQSATDASIAIAEGMHGTEAAFAAAMTDRARALGLTRSTFANATGRPDAGHKVTARELAMIARYMIYDLSEYYHYYAETAFTWNGITQNNRNPLLYMDIGVDGLQTGYTRDAGYGLVASAVRDGRRLVLVIDGLDSTKARATEAAKLLDWGFRAIREVAR